MPVEDYFDEEVNDETANDVRVYAPVGIYVFRVSSGREVDKGFPIELEVVDGTKDKAGLVHNDFLPSDSKKLSRQKRMAFAMATEIYTKQDVKDAKEAGAPLTFDIVKSLGCYMVAKIAAYQNSGPGEENEGKTSIEFSEMYHLDSTQAARLSKQYGGFVDRAKKKIAEMEAGDRFGDAESQQSAESSGGFNV